MDAETFQSLVDVYAMRRSADLLSILIDEATGSGGVTKVLALLRSGSTEILFGPGYDSARKKAALFCLTAPDFDLAARLTANPKTAEDKSIRARALQKLGQSSEASRLYAEAVASDQDLRSRDFERELGLRIAPPPARPPANVISLTTYSASARAKTPDRREQQLESILNELDETSVTFADVVGLDHIKVEIRRRIVLPYLKPSLFERFKRTPGGNLLVFGPPGCGKTLIGRAAASESDARFFPIAAEDILDNYGGDAEKRLRILFDEARSDPPAILFFDDFELLARHGHSASFEAGPALIHTLLSELHTPGRLDTGILTIAATNAPWDLDPAFFRSGRFHRILYAGLPDKSARLEMVKRALGDIPGVAPLDLDRIASKTSRFSGADIKAFCDWVCDHALAAHLESNGNAGVTASLIDKGLGRIPVAQEDWAKSAEKKFRRNLPSEFSKMAISVLYG